MQLLGASVMWLNENQGVGENEKLVYVAILAGDPRLSQYKQYKIKNSPYCDAMHLVVASTPVKVYPKDTVEFYPDSIPNFLAHAPPHPNVVPLLTAEQTREHKQALLDQSYNQSKAR